ncbi:MAG: neprosin family prolyl endopeptidase [Thermoanaerobaculales bacterium]
MSPQARNVGLATALLIAMYASLGSAASPGDQRGTPVRSQAGWQSLFEELRLSVPGFRVESVEELKRINAYYQGLIGDGRVLHVFETATGERIQCVDIASQRSFLASAGPGASPRLEPAEPPREVRGQAAGAAARPSEIGAQFGLDGSRDAAGNVRACPALTFPRLVPSIEHLYHFRRLEEMFRKHPDGVVGGLPHVTATARGKLEPPTAPTNHEYAHAFQQVDNVGSQADFNVWAPFVQQADEFSLSQLWVTNGDSSANALQSAETGWQVYPGLYGDSKPHLFVYYTTANYTTMGDNQGCYNLGCVGFVQTDSSVVIGGALTNVSTQGGPQSQITLSYYRDPGGTHDYWLRYNGTNVGYYPNSLYNAAGLANSSNQIDFGGEIVNEANGGVHTSTVMGSGRFPSEGYQHAAYIKNIQYWDTGGSGNSPTGLVRDVTNASYYDLALATSADPAWTQYFYFGGPGNTAPACTYSLDSASQSFPISGGSGSFGVVASASSCGWTASSSDSWITITSGASGTGNGSVGFTIAANGGAARSSTIIAAGQTFSVSQDGGSVSYAYSYWLPVISHSPGAGGTQWRSDVGVLNRSGSAANVEFQLYTGGAVLTTTQTVGGNAQVIGTDLAAQLGFTTGSGALQVLSTQPLVVTSRTFNLASSGFTYGQGYDGIASIDALAAGQSAYLPQLVQTGVAGQVGTYRTNIGITNTGTGTASVTLALFTTNGTQVWSDTRSYAPGQFYQYQEPYRTGAGLTNVGAGYAVLTVNSGSGVTSTASVIDDGSGDPTTENWKALPAASQSGVASNGTATLSDRTFTLTQAGGSVSYAYSYWLPVISHSPGAGGTQWRSDVGVLNPSSSSADLEFLLYTGGGTLTTTQSVGGNAQEIVTDLAAELGFTTGSGALEVLSTQPLLVTSRTYNLQTSGWTYGQGYDGIASSDALAAGQSAYLPQLEQTGVAGQVGTYRTNIGVTNTGSTAASVTLAIFTAGGTQVWSDTKSYSPGQFYQYQEPYRLGAGLTNVSAGYAVITVNSGSGVDAYASVIDDGSGDPTTYNFKR